MGLLLFLLAGMLLLKGAEAIYTDARRTRIDTICRIMVGELSAMQIRSLYIGQASEVYTLEFLSDGSGFTMKLKGKEVRKVYLSELGLGEYILSGPRSFRYLPGGAPSAYTVISITSRSDSAVCKKIEIQPITGRIVVTQ